MLRVSVTSYLAAFVAFGLAAMMVNHGLVDSAWPAGPGLTSDESFGIEQGVYLFDAFCERGPLLFTPTGAKEVFGSKRYFPDHAPLGRVPLGIAHQLTDWLIPGSESAAFNVPAARLGSTFAFALTVLLVCEFAVRRYGTATGILTAIMLIGMPHLTGHARIAAQESTTNLAWAAAMLPLLAWWTSSKPPSLLRAFFSGGIWGILFLTKIQGVFLPPIVFLWAIWKFRWKAILPLAIYGITGAAVFFAGWPWLWLDPVHNLLDYFNRTTDRSILYCWYLGQRYADQAVPWHFSFVMTLISLPAWTVVGLGLRIAKSRLAERSLDNVEQLLLLCALFPLFVFAIPGVPVYDGTRLFLIVFPPIAVLAARGVSLWMYAESSRPDNNKSAQRRRLLRIVVWVLLVVSPLFWIMQSLTILQYGLLAGGNRGAAWLGMEASYWSDALNSDFWQQVPEDSIVYVAPVSHQFQLNDIEALVPIVHHRRIRLIAYEYDPEKQQGLMLFIHRLADLRPELAAPPANSRLVTEVRKDGVTYAQLVDTSPAPAIDTTVK